MIICPFLHGGDAVAQVTWRRAYGGLGDEMCVAARAVSPDLIVAVGGTGSFGEGSGDIYLMAADGNGVRLWSRTIGGAGVERPASMEVCSNGDLIIAGMATGEGGYDGLLVRTDPFGDVLWSRLYGGEDWDFLNDVKELPDGGFLLAGTTFSFGGPGGRAWVLRTDADGDTLWTRTFGGAGGEALSVVLTPDGGQAIAGSLLTEDRDRDVLVVKLDTGGGAQWERTYGGDSLDVARHIILAPGGGYSLVGNTRSYSVWDEGYHLVLSEDGDLLQEHHWGLVADRGFQEHLVDGDAYLIAGYTEGFGGGGRDPILQRVTLNGDYVYGNTFGGLDDDEAMSLEAIGEGFLLGGWTLSYGSGGADFFLVRTGPDGLTASGAVQESFDPLPVEEQEAGLQALRLFPNPSYGNFSLSLDAAVLECRLIDAMGRPVELHRPPLADMQVHSGLPAGTYTVEVLLRDGSTRRGRLVLLHH